MIINFHITFLFDLSQAPIPVYIPYIRIKNNDNIFQRAKIKHLRHLHYYFNHHLVPIPEVNQFNQPNLTRGDHVQESVSTGLRSHLTWWLCLGYLIT